MADKTPREVTGDTVWDRIVDLQGGVDSGDRAPVDLTTVWGDPNQTAEAKLRAGRVLVSAWGTGGRHINLDVVTFDNNATHDPTVTTRIEVDDWDLDRGNFGQEIITKDSPGIFYAPDRTSTTIGPEQRSALLVKIADAVGSLAGAAA